MQPCICKRLSARAGLAMQFVSHECIDGERASTHTRVELKNSFARANIVFCTDIISMMIQQQSYELIERPNARNGRGQTANAKSQREHRETERRRERYGQRERRREKEEERKRKKQVVIWSNMQFMILKCIWRPEQHKT